MKKCSSRFITVALITTLCFKEWNGNKDKTETDAQLDGPHVLPCSYHRRWHLDIRLLHVQKATSWSTWMRWDAPSQYLVISPLKTWPPYWVTPQNTVHDNYMTLLNKGSSWILGLYRKHSVAYVVNLINLWSKVSKVKSRRIDKLI